MNQKALLGLSVAAVLGTLAAPAFAQVYGDTARVLSATPIYDRVAVPRRECRIEPGAAAEPREPVARDVERCDTIADATERIVGYQVRYEYNGRQFSARMPYDPGEQMPVNVEVRPPLAREGLRPRTPIPVEPSRRPQ
jgi:uncharacterized protein YcfJ